MQDDLDAMGLPVEVEILGVNAVGLENGNPIITMGRDIPWLQSTAAVDPWALWNVTYRDVIILDEQGYEVAVYNLTVHDLGIQANYDELLGMLVGYATD